MEKDKKKIKFFFVHLRKCVVNKEWWVGPDVRTRTEENVVYRYGDAVKREEKRKKKRTKDRRNVCDEQQGRRAAEVASIPPLLPQTHNMHRQRAARASLDCTSTGSG